MKVLMYNDYQSHIGGVETYIQEIASGLAELNIQARFLSFEDSPNYGQSGFQRAKKLRNRYEVISRIKKAFARAVKSYKPDLIHLHNNKLYTCSVLSAARESGIPVICDFHDHHFLGQESIQHFSIKFKLKQYLLKQTLQTAACFCCHSMRMKALLHQQGFQPVAYIPYFVNLEKWQDTHYVRPKAKRLVFLGRLDADKGIFIAIKAVEQLLNQIPDLELLCMGSGPAERPIRKYLKQKGLDKQIRLLGFKDQSFVNQVFQQSHALIFPSIYEEMFGISGIEAQAAGLPVIASRRGGIPEWCIHEKTGFLIKPNCPESLSQAIVMLFQRPVLVRQVVQAAQTFVRKNFNKSASIQKLVQLYETQITLNQRALFPLKIRADHMRL